MDRTDETIISMLSKDSRVSFVDIAKKAGLTEGAVRKRVKDLQFSGVIKKFTLELGAGKGSIRAFVFATASTNFSMKELHAKISAMPNVSGVFEVSGEFDMIVHVEGESAREINETVDRIRALGGITKTDTAFVMS